MTAAPMTALQKAIAKEKRERLEVLLASHLALAGVAPPVREHRFHGERAWRFDFAWPALMLAAEVEGATFKRGRHTRGKGFRADCEKYNAAAIDGWTVLRFDAWMVRRGVALRTIEQAIASRRRAA